MGKSLDNSMSSTDPNLRRQGRSKSPDTGPRQVTTPMSTKITDQTNNKSKSSKKPSGGSTSASGAPRSRWQHTARNKGHVSQSPQINTLIRNALNEDDDDSTASHSSSESDSSSDSSTHHSSSEDSRTKDDSDDEGMTALMNLYPTTTTTTTTTGDQSELDPLWIPLSPDPHEDSDHRKNSTQKNENLISLAAMAQSGSSHSDDDDSSSSASSSQASGSDAISVHSPTNDDDDDSGKHQTSTKPLSSRKIKFVPKGKQNDIQQKDAASASSDSAGFQVTTTSGNISTWEMRQKFKKEFPDDPMPSDDILRQLYRTEKVAEYERKERFKVENPGEPVPSDFVLRKLYEKLSTTATAQQPLPASSDTVEPAASTNMAAGETTSANPLRRTDLLKRMDSGLTFATEAEWEDYKKSSKSLDAGLGKVSSGRNPLFAFAEEDEDKVEFDAFGRDPCLRYRETALTLFPRTLLSKRVEDGEEIDVPRLFDLLKDEVARILKDEMGG